MLKRYTLKKHAQQVLGFSRKISSVFDQDLRTISYEKKVYSSAAIKLKTSVTDFYTRDDNSYMTPGKKETVTRNKTKMQKRLLLDSMTNLHKKYLRENSGSKMGYTLFCKFRPFWVVKPGLTDRQTCLCKKNASLQFKADRLHQFDVLSEKSIGTLVEGLACDRQRKRCMYNVAVMYQNTLPWTKIPIPMLSGGGNGYLRKNKNLVILVRTLNAKSPGKTKSLAHFSNLNHSLQLMFSSSENMSSTSATITMSSVNSVKDVRLHQMNVSYTLTFPKITVVVTQVKYKVSILERHITKQLCILAFCMWTKIQSHSVQSPTVAS